MTSQEAMRHTCKPGHRLQNVANVDETPDWREVPQPPHCDPNRFELFGYEQSEFLAKQYK
jgi:hypothetical protein